MIIPDLNLLIYAYNEGARLHAPAKRWWEDLLNGADCVDREGSSEMEMFVQRER